MNKRQQNLTPAADRANELGGQRTRVTREVNGGPRNAVLSLPMPKPAVAPPRRPRDELGLPENADKREVNGCPKNAVSKLAQISQQTVSFT